MPARMAEVQLAVRPDAQIIDDLWPEFSPRSCGGHKAYQ